MKRDDYNIYVNYNGRAFKVSTHDSVADAYRRAKLELATRQSMRRGRRGCPPQVVVQQVLEVLS